MKKSAWSAGAIRISPSAPTPRCRSHSAAMAPGSSRSASSRSSTITKSLPVPWYLANRTSASLGPSRPGPAGLHGFPAILAEVPDDLVDGLDRTARTHGEPPDAGIPPEPRALPPGQRLVPPGDPPRRLFLGELSPKTGRRLSVADEMGRSDERAEPSIEQGPGLLDQRGKPQPNPLVDPAVEVGPGEVDPGRPNRVGRVPVPRSVEVGERPAGDGGDLQRSHGPPGVGRLDPGGGRGIERGQAMVQRLRSQRRRFGLEQRPGPRFGSRKLQTDRHSSEVEPARSHQQGPAPPV